MEQGKHALLYDYPSDRYSRVEGKSLMDLDREIMVGSPFPESRIQRIYALAENADSSLHFVAKYYLYLAHERSKHLKAHPIETLPEGCAPNNNCDRQRN